MPAWAYKDTEAVTSRHVKPAVCSKDQVEAQPAVQELQVGLVVFGDDSCGSDSPGSHWH